MANVVFSPTLQAPIALVNPTGVIGVVGQGAPFNGQASIPTVEGRITTASAAVKMNLAMATQPGVVSATGSQAGVISGLVTPRAPGTVVGAYAGASPGVVVTAGGLTAPFPLMQVNSLIGGNRTGYASSQYQKWASLWPFNLVGWLVGGDTAFGFSMASVMQAIKAMSPFAPGVMKIGEYYDPTYLGTPASNVDSKLFNAYINNKWFLLKPYPNGPVATNTSGGYTTNLTAGGPLDAQGRNAYQMMAQFMKAWMVDGDQAIITSGRNTPNPFIDYINFDDQLCLAQVLGDYKRNGTQSNDSADSTAMRVANIAQANYVRSLFGLPVSGNLSQMGLQGSSTQNGEYAATPFDYGWCDQQVGTNQCLENNNSRQQVIDEFVQMARCVRGLAGVAHFNINGTDGTDAFTWSGNTITARSPPWQGARHGMAMINVLSDFGHGPSATLANDCNQTPIWFDEQTINLANRTAYAYPNVSPGLGWLGKPIDPPQIVPVQGNGFRRRYEKGEIWWLSRRDPPQTVLFQFPDGSPRTVHKIIGGQNPTYNNGAAITQQAMASRDGVFVVY